ncbi:MBL fold metallo-hydrolase [Streptomyces sp. NPDC056983]|uniref:MBL fold metallo-hydrolase n=1 Tax=Streptomyces sp. NPDC056983 TaxID=3345987 RepID=UPI0036374E03
MVTTFAVGDLTVHRIVELVAPFMPALEMLPDLTPELLDENRHWLGPDQIDADDQFVLSYQSYVVRTPHHTVLVDSCLGNDKERPRPEWHRKTDDRFLRGLASIGLRVEDIDYVMCTHFHGDHVGWNTRLVDGRWQPTFPRARYVFSRAEVEATALLHRESPLPAYADSVLPILDAGLADLADEDFEIGEHIRVLPTQGHTDGHMSFRFGLKRDAVVFTGDLLHVPLQLRYPSLSFVRDRDPEAAAKTRHQFVERYCETDTVCCTGHFLAPGCGRIQRWGEGFRLVAG